MQEVTATVYKKAPIGLRKPLVQRLSIDEIAEYILDRLEFLKIDKSIFEDSDNSLNFQSDDTFASTIITVDLSPPNASIFNHYRLPRYQEGKPILVITRSGQEKGEVDEASSLTERLLRCNQDEMLDVIRAATQAEYDNRKSREQQETADEIRQKDAAKQEKARWWKSILSTSVSLWPLNPSNFALATLIFLSIGLVIAKYASLPTLAQVAPLLGDFMMLGAVFFGLTLITVAPFLLYEHYTGQRYKYWLKHNTNDNSSYTAYLQDNVFEFGFFAYLSSIYNLAWENKGKALMIIGTTVISGLLTLASVGFIYHNPIAESLMQPFFDVITCFLTHTSSTLLMGANIQILAAVAAFLFPLVIMDTARRIIELFEKAKADSINPQFGSQETYCEMRPEHDSFAGMQESLDYHFSNFFTQSSEVETTQKGAFSSSPHPD